ncbi:hypothetical protein PMAYCL1PPCAC_25989, partial [Pristionchus mayeri]
FSDFVYIKLRIISQVAIDRAVLYLRHTYEFNDRKKGALARKYNLPPNFKMAEASNSFDAPTEFTNVVLIVEGKNLHVNKEFLAIHSPVFAAMFFGEFAEKGKEEVEIKDIVFEEFVDLLNVIHPSFTPITETSVSHILKLSDQFQMKGVLTKSEKFLIVTKRFNIVKKMTFADQYNLQKL